MPTSDANPITDNGQSHNTFTCPGHLPTQPKLRSPLRRSCHANYHPNSPVAPHHSPWYQDRPSTHCRECYARDYNCQALPTATPNTVTTVSHQQSTVTGTAHSLPATATVHCLLINNAHYGHCVHFHWQQPPPAFLPRANNSSASQQPATAWMILFSAIGTG